MPVSHLEHFLNPRSVAVIGASDRAGSRGSYIWRSIRRSALASNVWAVNPKYKYIGERPCFAKVSDIPTHIDVAVIALKSDRILSALREVGESKIPYVLITPNEQAQANDKTWLKELLLTASFYGTKILGPDTIGLMNPPAGINLSYWPSLPRSGNIAFIAQSAMIATSMIDYANGAELGFSGIVSTGSEIDIGLPELIDYYAADRNTRVIAIHLEGVRQPRHFYSSLRNAASTKPVIVLKANHGSSFAADRLATMRFGTDAGTDAGFTALVEQAGAIHVTRFTEFTATISAFATNRIPRGNRIAVISNGTGFGALTADTAHSFGVEIAGLTNATIRKLQEIFKSPLLPFNPIDVGPTASSSRYKETLHTVLNDESVDGAIVVVAPSPISTIDPTLRVLATTAYESYKPVITAWVSDRITRSVREQLRLVPDARISAIQSPSAAMLAFGYLARLGREKAERLMAPTTLIAPSPLSSIENIRRIVHNAREEGRHCLTPDEANALLQHIGITSAKAKIATSLEEAIATANFIGYPVALKVLASGVEHKSEVGGVLLDIENDDMLSQAWKTIKQNLREKAPFTVFEGMLVQAMIPHSFARELKLGIEHDNVLGPLVLFGAGGLTADIYNDYAVALPPLTLRNARQLISKPHISKTFGKFQGLAPIHTELLVQTLLKISDLAVAIPAIRDMTLNPVIVSEDQVIAVDVNINLNNAAIEPSNDFEHLTILACPREDITKIETKKGDVTLRAISEQDFFPLKAFLSRLSAQTRYLRFHANAQMSDERIVESTQVDYLRESVWVIAQPDAIYAIARFKQINSDTAEFGIVVEDDWQRLGLARHLMDKLEKEAKHKGLVSLVGYVLKGNDAMESMMRLFGYKPELSADTSDNTIAWIKPL